MNGGTLDEDGCDHGLYLPGDKVKITAPATDKDGNAFEAWTDSAGKTVSTSASCELTVGEKNEVYTPTYKTKTSEGLYFVSNGDGTCYVAGIGTCKDKDIVIPKISPDDDIVTSIGNNAFKNCTSFTSINIPDSVTSIGNYAFYNCTSLTSITIPDSVTSIGDSAFYYCTSLTSVSIGNSVTSIGDYAFYYCTSLESVTIPDSVTSIGGGAFYVCRSLTSITIPDSVTSIGYYAFKSCTRLTSITIPDSVTSIGDCAFSGCMSLTSITIPDSVTYLGGGVFYKCSSLANVIIGNGIKEISYYYNNSSYGRNYYGAFEYCTSLTSINIPDSVTSIGELAFSGCTSLASITIPDSVTSIGSQAFSVCTSLTSVTIPNSVTSIGKHAFSYCTSLKKVYYKGTADKWSDIAIGSSNSYLTAANRYYFSETEPTTSGNWWHYDASGNVTEW